MALQEIIQNIYHSIYRGKARRVDVPINFCERLAEVRNIVIILPQQKNHFDAIIAEMEGVKKIFPATAITLLYHRNNIMPAAYANRFTLVEWGDGDINRFGGPTMELKRRLFISPCDLIIDFNPEYQFFSLCLIQASGAPIKVCFEHPRRQDFYNLIYRPHTLHDLTNATRSLLKYLSPTGKSASKK